MAWKKNTKHNDGIVTRETDGNPGEYKMSKYDALGTVLRLLGDQQYLVELDDGAELMASFDEGHVAKEGTPVGLIAFMGGWKMEETAGQPDA